MLAGPPTGVLRPPVAIGELEAQSRSGDISVAAMGSEDS